MSIKSGNAENSEALRASELSYRRLFEAAKDGILILDITTGRVTDANPFLCKLLGFSHTEMVGQTVGELSPFRDIVANEAMLQRLKKDGYVRYENLPLDTKDGRHIAVEFVSNVYQAGDIKVIQCNIRDITDRRRTEKNLRDSNEQFRAMFEMATIGMAMTDPETGAFLRVNQKLCEITGYTAGEMLMMSVRDITHRDDRDEDWAQFQRVVKVEHPDYHMEKRYLHKDGRNVWVSVNRTVVRNEAGHPFRCMATIEDITDRRRSESRLLLQSRALEAAENTIVITDKEGLIEWANSAFCTNSGYSLAETIGQNPRLLNSGHQDDKFYRDMWATISLGNVWHGEVINRRKDGSLYTEEMTITPVTNDAGEIEHYIAVKQDITERKRLENQFMRAQRMESIGTLAGGIAHDLNNILAPILLSIEMLKETSTDPESVRILETIELSAKQGADIVKQVLSFARGLEGKKIEVQARHLLKNLENIIKNTFPKDIRLRLSIPNDTWTILGDPTQVQQILLNLCVNARDAMPSGGALTLGLENCVLDDKYATQNLQAKPGRYVAISVTDSGTGMRQNIIDKIFDPFFTTKELNQGTGLGLSTVMGIVKSHEGTINVYSEVGKGTTFKVYLPAAKTSLAGQDRQSQSLRLQRGNNEMILVVDDETSIRKMTSQILQTFGYRVLTATDGADAVAVYARNKDDIAVVLTDMAMPVMDGSAAIVALRRINPLVKIIAASGLHARLGFSKLHDTGIKHTLTKPFTSAALLETLRAILDEA